MATTSLYSYNDRITALVNNCSADDPNNLRQIIDLTISFDTEYDIQTSAKHAELQQLQHQQSQVHADVKQSVAAVDSAIIDVEHKLQQPDTGLIAIVNEHYTKQAVLHNEQANIDTTISALQALADVCSGLKALNAQLSRNESLTTSAESIAALQQQVSTLLQQQPTLEYTYVGQQLAAELDRCQSTLTYSLVSGINQIITFNVSAPDGSSSDFAASMELKQPAAATLQSIYQAAQTVGAVDGVMQHLASEVCQQLVTPLLTNATQQHTMQPFSVAYSASSATTRFECRALSGDETGQHKSLLEANTQLLFFLADRILLSDALLAQTFASAFWPEVSAAVRDTLITTSTPLNVFDWLSYDASIVQPLKTLQQQVGSALNTAQPLRPSLTSYTNDIEANFAQQSAQRVQSHAQQPISTTQHTVYDPKQSQLTSEQSLFHQPTTISDAGRQQSLKRFQAAIDLLNSRTQAYCQVRSVGISELAYTLSGVMFDTVCHSIDIAAARHTGSAGDELQQLYSQSLASVNETVTAFSTKFVETHTEQLASVPAVAYLFINDCQYLTHMLTLIQTYHRDCLKQEDLQGQYALLDFASQIMQLKSLSHKYEKLQSQRSKALIQSMLDELGGLQEIETVNRRQHVTRVLRQVLHSIQLHYQSLHTIAAALPLRAELVAMIELLLQHLLDALLDMQDISVEGNQRIYACLDMVLQHPTVQQYSSHVASYEKFRATAAFIHPDQSLARLTSEVDAGKYDTLSTQEVQQYVMALYEASAKRDAFLMHLIERESERLQAT